jgi:uncharacterized protein (DUF1330 family)
MRSNNNTTRNEVASRPSPNAIAALVASVLLLLGSTVGAQSAAPSAAPATTQAAAAPASGYLLVLGRTLDRPKLIRYSMTLPPIYAASGGRYIATGRPGSGIRCITGLCEGRSAVVAYWENASAVSEFWWGSSYRQAVPLRDRAGVFTVAALKGQVVSRADAQPHPTPGAFALALTNGDAGQAPASTWLAGAQAAGGRSLVPFERASVSPLEGDALFDRALLLSFASAELRDRFLESSATKDFIRLSSGGPSIFLLALIAIDAPAAPPNPAAPSSTASTTAPSTAPTPVSAPSSPAPRP